jgi:hypothetical protein
MKKHVLLLLVVCINTVAFSQSVSFKIPLWFSSPDTNDWWPESLYIGVHPSATYCIDDSLGEFFFFDECGLMRPPPCQRFINPRGWGNGCDYFPLYTDIRPYISSNQRDTFLVTFWGAYPITLHWSPNFRNSYDSAIVADVFGGMFYKVDMLSTDSIIIDDNRFTRLVIRTYGPKVITDVQLRDEQLPSAYSLSQNYPNPFNPSTKILYSVESKQYVSLKIYDILGREVATLVNELQPAGTYEVEWKAESLTNGMYFYRLHVGNHLETKKMLLIK